MTFIVIVTMKYKLRRRKGNCTYNTVINFKYKFIKCKLMIVEEYVTFNLISSICLYNLSFCGYKCINIKSLILFVHTIIYNYYSAEDEETNKEKR